MQTDPIHSNQSTHPPPPFLLYSLFLRLHHSNLSLLFNWKTKERLMGSQSHYYIMPLMLKPTALLFVTALVTVLLRQMRVYCGDSCSYLRVWWGRRVDSRLSHTSWRGKCLASPHEQSALAWAASVLQTHTHARLLENHLQLWIVDAKFS